MRLFPTKNEEEKIQLMFEQFKWYYNAAINITYNHIGKENITKEKLNFSTIRDIIRKYEYTEEETEKLIFTEFNKVEGRNKIPCPDYWSKIHSRLPRGAIHKFVSSINSAVSNFKNKNINHFNMKYMTKKSINDFLSFEDKGFPSMFKDIKSHYWVTTKDRKRIFLNFKDIQCNDKGIEIVYDKIKKQYFLHYPVDYDWYPKADRRNDSQVMYVSDEDRVIALDPGIRKFMVGYDPQGKCIFIGENENSKLVNLLLKIDLLVSIITKDDFERERIRKKKHMLWLKVKNMVDELHWKTIKFLTDNYDIIIYPNFMISGMVKGKKISKLTKRLLYMYSFFRFQEKLKYKCRVKEKKLIICTEEYTSKTCGKCGTLNNTQGKEILTCSCCGITVDRDATGSRNIFLKNLKPRSTLGAGGGCDLS